jgi:type I restriction enzyme, R subunit
MALTPEELAREQIDRLLQGAGRVIQDLAQANLSAARGVAIRSFPLKAGHGFADYLLYVDGKAAGDRRARQCPLRGRGRRDRPA